jgi:HEAT repeat protein
MSKLFNNRSLKSLAAFVLLIASQQTTAQTPDQDKEALKLAAVEALISAPPERAMPLARKVLEGNNSDELKEKALFVLSQIDEPEAQQLILLTAQDESSGLRYEAIRMIGIGGDPDALAQLGPLFADGDEELQEAILEAYLIADADQAVYQIALDAKDDQAFARAVQTLSVMGAHDLLRQLRDNGNRGSEVASEALIDAYAISGDSESLRALATDPSNPEQQLRALEGLGVIGGDKADAILLDIYRSTDNLQVRESAIEGLMISGNDQAILELFQASSDAIEKKQLLKFLVIMDSEAVWQVIDQALDGGT